MTAAHDALWDLTFGRTHIDAAELALVLEQQVAQPPPDVRTCMLIRESLDALCAYWGDFRFQQWLNNSDRREELARFWRSDLGPEKFPSLRHRIMDAIRPETVRQYLRELGTHLSSPLSVNVGGAIVLILDKLIARATEDIDLVDEIPLEIRAQHELIDELSRRYGLRLTHFQSHYLPTGWQMRVRSLGRFGQLDVFLVDSIDIFVGKLFSARQKDLDDLRELARQIDRSTVERRVGESAKALIADRRLADQARKNWYILYGDTLAV